MPLFKTLSTSGDADLRAWVAATSAGAGLSNVFNVSVLRSPEDGWFATFRAQRTCDERPFRAYLISRTGDQATTIEDLTQRNADAGVLNVADPKLTLLRGNVYVTFNSGFSASAENDLYLQQITPVIGQPRRCKLERRQVVEKNWAFFIGNDGVLRAMYSAAPELVVIRADSSEEGSGSVHFEREWSESSGIASSLSIGTQFLDCGNSSRLIVLHRKLQLGGKRLYVGRLARFDLDTRRGSILVSRVPLVHSVLTLLPARRRPNANLISATYFSGLSEDRGDLLISYGINDLDFGIARIEERNLWS